MGGFEYRQAEEIRDALARHEVRYLFIGKAGAVLLGFPDRRWGKGRRVRTGGTNQQLYLIPEEE